MIDAKLLENNPGIEIADFGLLVLCGSCGEPKEIVAAGVNSFVLYCENKGCVNWHYPTEIQYKEAFPVAGGNPAHTNAC